jgi:ribosomal protein S6
MSSVLRYETLILTVPELTADEASRLESQFEQTLTQHKANPISFERWGKYHLAYPVRNNDYGVYFLARFEVNDKDALTALLNDLHMLLAVKNTELVMRHTICRLDANASLSYNRPESLEEAPARDVDTFLKENKMTGIGRGDRFRSGRDSRRRDDDQYEEAAILEETDQDQEEA